MHGPKNKIVRIYSYTNVLCTFFLVLGPSCLWRKETCRRK